MVVNTLGFDFVLLLSRFVRQFAKIFPRISLHDLPCHRTMRKCLCKVSQKMVAFQLLQQRFWIQTYFYNCPQYLCLFDILVECNPHQHGQGTLTCTSHIGSTFCFFPASFMSTTNTDKNSLFSRLTNKHSCPTMKISLKMNDWIVMLDHDFGHLCFGGRIQVSGHSDFGLFKKLMHLPF